MYHAVAHAHHVRITVRGSEPQRQTFQCFDAIANIAVQVLVDEDPPLGIPGGKAWRGGDAFDLAARFEAPVLLVRSLVDAKLQARRTSVQHQRVVIH